MAKLEWDQVGTRRYEIGVDHGVLYLEENGEYKNGVAWNGLISVDSDSKGETAPLYSGDVKVGIAHGNEEASGTISAYTYPDEFERCIGSIQAIPGIFVRQQERATFGFSYRTFLGNDVKGQEYGYRIHLIYGAEVTDTSISRGTVNDSVDNIEMSWDYESTPIVDDDYEPYSELIIDSTLFSTDFMDSLASILYGTEDEDPRMPTLDELIDLFSEEEQAPKDWSGYPHELAYPSETEYPFRGEETSTVTVTIPPQEIEAGGECGGATMSPGDSFVPINAWIATVDYTRVPDELADARFTYGLSDDRKTLFLIVHNDLDSSIELTETAAIVVVLHYRPSIT